MNDELPTPPLSDAFWEAHKRKYAAWKKFELKRRPLEQRCRNCIHWESPNPEAELAMASDPECLLTDGVDTRGECHRNAPSTTGIDLAHIGNLLGLIAHAVEETAELEHDKYTDYEGCNIGEIDVYGWPTTKATDWCSQFEAGRIKPTQEELNEFKKLDAAVEAERPPPKEDK